MDWVPGVSRLARPDVARHVFSLAVAPSPLASGFAVARGHSVSARDVVDALAQLSTGASYASVGELLASRAGSTDPRGRDVWRRAADTLEVFGPILRDHWRTSLPPVDEAPVLVCARPVSLVQRPRARASLYVHAVGRVTESGVRLELARVLPRADAPALQLVLDDWVEEFGVVPAAVVGPAGLYPFDQGTGPALPAHLGTVPLWIAPEDVPELARSFAARVQAPWQCTDLADSATAAFSSRDLLGAWTQELSARGLPHEAACVARAAEPWQGAVLSARYRGACSELQVHADALAPLLRPRVSGLGNLARTAALMDVLVLGRTGYFGDRYRCTRILWEHLAASGGYAPAVRAVVDPGAYRSLDDLDLVDELLVWRSAT